MALTQARSTGSTCQRRHRLGDAQQWPSRPASHSRLAALAAVATTVTARPEHRRTSPTRQRARRRIQFRHGPFAAGVISSWPGLPPSSPHHRAPGPASRHRPK
ncbi:hypothetical protein HBB16_20775 [Pseudonocardia sp. MCCB 268]|nr:hypothetical protein [Pseudonocardia cytotoxica]